MLSYSDSGKGSVVVLLHGLGLNRNVWSSTMTNLYPTCRCVAIDLPGHGASRAQICDGSMSAYAKAVREVIEKLNLTDITLVGHSMGGQIGIILALQMPSVISKLVLVCAAGIETYTADEAEKLKSSTYAAYANPITDDVMSRSFFHLIPEIKTMLMSEHVNQQKENFPQLAKLVTTSVAGMLNEPVSQFLPLITQKTLVINGALDAAIPNRWLHPKMTVNDVQNMTMVIPNSEQVIFPIAGHYLPVDQPMELAKKIASL